MNAVPGAVIHSARVHIASDIADSDQHCDKSDVENIGDVSDFPRVRAESWVYQRNW